LVDPCAWAGWFLRWLPKPNHPDSDRFHLALVTQARARAGGEVP
jgi:hypothetical protein